MEISVIKREIEKEGYKSFLKEIDSKIYSKKYLLAGIHDDATILKMESTFQVYLEKDKILLSYLNGQVSNNLDFSTVNDLVSFVKKQFPITN